MALREVIRVIGGNNGLFYMYSDHLGSASLLVNSSNNPVAGSRTWYLPFGGYRPGSAPTQTITDRDFTDQRENMELGLLYYQARFYVPGLGRFTSADTIVPNPANPQSYNRYSYVENRPLTFRDPTGHISCTDSNLPGDDQQACQATPPPIWVRPFIDKPDWVKYYGHTKGSGYSSTNAGQHPGLDQGKDARTSFGATTWNKEAEQWNFDGTYDTPARPRIPVYAACYCWVDSIGEGSPYAPGRVYLTHEDHPDFLLINGHLMPNKYDGEVVIETNILVSAGQKVTPNTVIGYLEETERHVHVEIRRKSDNHFENPFPYLSSALQVQMLSFQGRWPNTTYQLGYPSDPANQPDGYYIQ